MTIDIYYKPICIDILTYKICTNIYVMHNALCEYKMGKGIIC